jgi:hypothetical protein
MIAVQDSGFATYAVIAEPELEFGKPLSGDGRATDPQKGLEKYGPYSTRLGGRWHPATTTIVPVASSGDWDMVVSGLRRLQDFQKIADPNACARIDYPGFESAFRSRLVIDTRKARTQVITDASFNEALGFPSAADGYRHVLACIEQSFRQLPTMADSAVVALYLPPAVVEKFRRFTPDFKPVQPEDRSSKSERGRPVLLEELDQPEGEEPEETLYHDLRRSIKVMCMRLNIACQVLTNHFIEEDPGQPWAGKLWNIGTSIFCKAGGIPWRVVTNENVAYCGVRFGVTKDRKGQSILVGLAQVFNGAGELVALRAGQAVKRQSHSERGYYLSQDQARTLLSGAIADYQVVTGKLPDRVVVHKSSPYKGEEIQGMEEAAGGVRELDLIFIKAGAALRLIPDRGQPADRGSVVPTSADSALVYTTGFEGETGKWRGKHVPKPYEIVRFKSARSLVENARDVLRLTKMNWNTTLNYGREPCTFTNATEVIGMMKELRNDDVLKPNIRYYI